MTDVISKLNDLFQDHLSFVHVSNQQGMDIITSNRRYDIENIKNSIITIPDTAITKTLHLLKCKNIKINCARLPVSGIVLDRCDNVLIDIDGDDPGYLELNEMVYGIITINSSCRIEVDRCTGILLNGINISDQYRDSTWEIIPRENENE